MKRKVPAIEVITKRKKQVIILFIYNFLYIELHAYPFLMSFFLFLILEYKLAGKYLIMNLIQVSSCYYNLVLVLIVLLLEPNIILSHIQCYWAMRRCDRVRLSFTFVYFLFNCCQGIINNHFV